MMPRLAALAALLPQHGLDALLVAGAANLRYLAGYACPAASLLVTPQQAMLILPPGQAALALPGIAIVAATPGGKWLRELATAAAARRIGYETAHIPTSAVAAWVATLKADTKLRQVSLVGVAGLVEGLRVIKSPEELEAIRQAALLLAQTWAEVSPRLEPGQAERAIAAHLTETLRQLGAEAVAPPLVAAGPNGADPSHQPGEAPLRPGQPVLIRLAACVNGYWATLARTISLGPPDAAFCRWHDLALGAQLTAIHTMQPGMTGAAVAALARPLLEAAGPDVAVEPSLGHGVGLELTEAPRLGPDEAEPLRPGMVFAVSPALYAPGWGGVTLADVVELTDAGARPLVAGVRGKG